eukprot:NODE_14722_length_439_cov_65.098101_g14423_i0.p1 GENE.NODE_14722_length_439_cov_65.098101_g14423_i0~~NODE_14722_length_439_cov_65.098101_g14423_i0.p1  ORF type:complete len:124 (+),score=2.07 NODE_14722_length_439_cov_65.098101_g14423_i0:64-435(+)
MNALRASSSATCLHRDGFIDFHDAALCWLFFHTTTRQRGQGLHIYMVQHEYALFEVEVVLIQRQISSGLCQHASGVLLGAVKRVLEVELSRLNLGGVEVLVGVGGATDLLLCNLSHNSPRTLR